MDLKKVSYVKPDYAADREKDRRLLHIATRGVTQLFNAVAERQTFLEKKVGQMAGQPRKERKRIVEELRQYDFQEGLSKNAPKIKKPKTNAEIKPNKEELEADETLDVSGISSGVDEDATDIEIKEEAED